MLYVYPLQERGLHDPHKVDTCFLLFAVRIDAVATATDEITPKRASHKVVLNPNI